MSGACPHPGAGVPESPQRFRADDGSDARGYDQRRAASPHRRLYGRRWRAYRLMFLAANPLCVMCLEKGKTVAASVVDHRIPHKGDYRLFWTAENHQPLCEPHHNSDKQRIERASEGEGGQNFSAPLR